MLKRFKAPLAAFMLSAAVIVPTASITFVATADAAYAKQKKEKKAKKEKKSKKAKSQKRSSRTQSAAPKRQAQPKKPAKARKSSPKTQTSAQVTGDEVVNGDVDLASLHPSQLGNMNGALNANENAILAHIRNGNTTNGPVGLMAALAIANSGAEDADAALDTPLADDYSAVEDAARNAGYDSYQDYLASGDEPVPAIEDQVASIGQVDLDNALRNYGSYDEYRAAVIGNGTAEEPENPELVDVNIELLNDAVGQYDTETADNLTAAREDVGSRDDALQDLVDYWNKGGEDSDDAEALKQQLLERVDSYENVDGTLEALADDEMDGESEVDEDEVVEDGTCDEAVSDCTTDETALVIE